MVGIHFEKSTVRSYRSITQYGLNVFKKYSKHKMYEATASITHHTIVQLVSFL
jgi:hypothetical protein